MYKTYSILSVLLFLVELYIARYVTDSIIRPFVGDALIVILIYTGIRSFISLPYLKLAVGVLLFAYGIEALQALGLIYILQWEDKQWARLLLGHVFDWKDLIAYTIGFLVILTFEKLKTIMHNSG